MTRPAADEIEAAILRLLAERGPGKSISPEEAARAAGGAGWHALLASVRTAAQRLARAGRIVVLRKGKPVDPDGFKGVYRLALPEVGEGNSSDERPARR
jgi:hypothetical protein